MCAKPNAVFLLAALREDFLLCSFKSLIGLTSFFEKRLSGSFFTGLYLLGQNQNRPRGAKLKISELGKYYSLFLRVNFLGECDDAHGLFYGDVGKFGSVESRGIFFGKGRVFLSGRLVGEKRLGERANRVCMG